jgi:hypothetical protein
VFVPVLVDAVFMGGGGDFPGFISWVGKLFMVVAKYRTVFLLNKNMSRIY